MTAELDFLSFLGIIIQLQAGIRATGPCFVLLKALSLRAVKEC